LTLAIVDDLGAIVVIAVFYSAGVDAAWLVGAAAAFVVVLVMRRLGVAATWWYVPPSVALWLCMHESGVHAAIAGFVLALAVRGGRGRAVGPLERLERLLHPWSSFAVVPLFALANAGVVLSGAAIADAVDGRVFLGVMLGLVVGKCVGIAGCTALGVGLGLRLPPGVTTRDVVGLGALAGIGFTVSIFVADLSFAGALLDEAKLGIFAASLVAGVLGAAVLALAGSPQRRRALAQGGDR
jgi:NhaA family Na+:H+ antiporter